MAFPTETVYGLGAAAEDPAALERLFAAKGRPRSHPVIVHGADMSVLARYGDGWPPLAETLAGAFWPGPLTLVVTRSDAVLDAVSGGQNTVGLRVPDHPVALGLLEAFGSGVAAPSANRFGRISPTSADAVRSEFGQVVAAILDGGAPTIGIESTVLDLTGPQPSILRPGAISAADLAEIVGRPVGRMERDEGPRAPGRMAAHYAPHARLELIAPDQLQERAAELRDTGARIAVLSPEPASVPGAVLVADHLEHDSRYAHELYATMRRADAAGVDVILAIPPTGSGLAEAVRDRLQRASSSEPAAGGR